MIFLAFDFTNFVEFNLALNNLQWLISYKT